MSDLILGVHSGVVVDLDDPTSTGRARLSVPTVFGGGLSGWATPLLGKNGVATVKVGDTAWVMFEQGKITRPTWIGAVDLVPTGTPVDWTSVLNKPTTFPPSTHTHSTSSVTSGTFALARIPSIDYSRLPVGTDPNTVAAGNDSRFPNQMAWAAWTPTFAGDNGGAVAATVVHARRQQTGKVAAFSLQFTITSLGTATGNINVTNMTASAVEQVVSGRDNSAGPMLQGSVGGAVMTIRRYDNASVLAVGKTLTVSGSYETT